MGRTEIRDRVQTNVVSSDAVGSRAYIGKYDAVPDGSSLPAAFIRTGEDIIEPMTMKSPRKFRHSLDVIIRVFAEKTATQEVEEVLDTATEDINDTMEGDRTLNGSARDCTPTAVVYEISDEGDRPQGYADMTYSVYYETAETA